ncbi:patatin-like phospholipase family protein [Gammaproteobacteria bacterium]|nr:patatin-like phospholipase family protein [Gammaproteobacteria bacterium]
MKTKYILSMDGGGVRTLASITFLKLLEKKLGVKIHEKFDFFIGTSAGAISCLALASKNFSAIDLEKIWAPNNLKKTMQSSSWELRLGLLQSNPKYTNVGKREVLKKYFGKTILGESNKPVAVLSYDIQKRSPVLFRSYDKEDKDISLVDVGDATSAAPIYYPTAKVGNRYLIDGAIVANHPVLHGYVEAKKLFPDSEIRVLSVGTGLSKRSLNGEASMKWGIVGWLMHDLFGLMVESSLDHELAGEIIGEHYLRVNSAINSVNRRLDDRSSSNIQRVVKMGEDWWEQFGDRTVKLLSE